MSVFKEEVSLNPLFPSPPGYRPNGSYPFGFSKRYPSVFGSKSLTLTGSDGANLPEKTPSKNEDPAAFISIVAKIYAVDGWNPSVVRLK